MSTDASTDASPGKLPLGNAAPFDKQRAVEAIAAFDTAQLSALAVAGYLPGAIARIEELEEMCRGCLRVIAGVPQPTMALQVLEACLRSVLEPKKSV